jgi:hypothetical protein
MALDRTEFILDDFHAPEFDPNLGNTIKITSGETYLNAPSNLDLITIDLLDEVDSVVSTFTGHISNIGGIKYEAGLLHLDTFQIVASQFGRTSGGYQIKISGYRNYIYDAIVDPNNETKLVDVDDAVPNQIQHSKLEVIEVSKSGTEVRLKATAKNAVSFADFYNFETPGTLPIDGFYWKYMNFSDNPNINTTVYFAKFSEGYNPSTNLAFSSEAQYAAHRIERGLIGQDGDGKYVYDGVREVNPDGSFQFIQFVGNQGVAGSVDDIWPVYLQVTKPLSGDKLNLVALNWMYHEYVPKPDVSSPNDQPEPVDTLILKLASPVPPSLKAGINVSLLRPLFIPYNVNVDIDIPFLIDESFTELRGPNLRLGLEKNSAKATLIKNEEELVGTNQDIKNRLEAKIISGSGIEVNYDFTQYKNFVHFSSAEERLKNFRYKIQQIEHYESKSLALGDGFAGTDSDVTGSLDVIANKLQFDNLKRGFIRSFTPYEEHLYYESSSVETRYTDEGEITLNPTTWPKSNSERTGLGYNLFSVTSSEATTWYTAQLTTASLYDQTNMSMLRNSIPIHIKTDSENQSYEVFMDMVGEHFDTIFHTIKDFEETYKQKESVSEGISKDLLLDAAKSFGVNLYPGYSSADLWDYVLGTDNSGTYQASGSSETRTFVKKDSHSSGDIEKQTWKRIVNNLPLLLKTKGTARGVRALLTSYGIPLTILNIDEYGGAPVKRSADKREIQKFNYAVDFSGSAHLQTTHAFIDFDDPGLNLSVSGSGNRALNMYEFRIDTSTTQSMHLASSDENGAGTERWVLMLEHSSSAAGHDSPSAIAAGSASVYANYGRVTFYLSGSAAQPAVSCSTDYAPFYNNDWWNISFGCTEHAKPSITNTFELRYAAASEHANGRLTHTGSVSVAANIHNMNMWADTQKIRWGGSGSSGQAGSDFTNLQPFSGSWQEIRGWAEYLSTDAFHQHTLAPTSIIGDSIESAYNDLFLRIPLGTDLKRYDVTSPGTTLTLDNTNYLGSIPNDYNAESGYSIGWNATRRPKFIGWQSIPFTPKSETYYVKVPHTAGPSKHSNKIRIEDNTLRNNTLGRDQSFEQSSFDSNPLDSEDVSVVLSPADQIDTDISMQFGSLDLDDYIGDPRDKYKYEYTGLRNLKNLYFKKYTGGTNVMAFVQFLRSFNKGLFKQIEDMLPARADAIVGIEIRPNLLERHKIATIASMSQENLQLTSSITLTSTHDLPNSEIINSQTFFGSDIGTLSALIGVGAAPSQQRSGSNDYFNLYRGATYLRDVFGEATESAVQTYVSGSPIWSGGEDFKFVPTFNLYHKPDAFEVPVSQSGVTGSAAKAISNLYPKAVDIQPNYIYSPAQRRLIIEGTRINSPDFNVGSSETIDGGPVAEYLLVNPNIITVDPNQTTDSFGDPVSPLSGYNQGRGGSGGTNQASQINVR